MSNMFRIMKSVGSPSVEGAIGVETLASHSTNPEAHPDYVKKSTVPAVFSETEHLTNRLAHAADIVRRVELVTSKMDYERAKASNVANDPNNYMATTGLKRHVITAYVLNQILEGFGLVNGKVYLSTNLIVGTSTVSPSADLDNYVVSYGLFLQLKRKLDDLIGSGLSDVYLKKVDAANTYTKLSVFNGHNHDAMTLLGMPGVMNFGVTYDTVYAEGKSYYKYNSNTYKMEVMTVGTDYTVGATIPENKVVFEEYGAYTSSMWHDIETVKSNVSTNTTNISALQVRNGYALTADTTVVPGVEYFIVSGDTMTKVTSPSGSPVAKGYWCKIKNNAGTEALAAKIGYALTTDTTRVPGVVYYKFNASDNTMTVDTTTTNPATGGLFVKVTNWDKKIAVVSGYALTADTTVVEGVQYYAYNATDFSMDQVANPTGNPQQNGWYIKARSTASGGGTEYNDAELRAKSGYALTVDTTPITGITYYYYDSSSKKMVAYSPAPTNPSTVGAWTKIRNVTPSGGTVDLTELQAKAPYAESLDTERVEGINYFVYNSSTGTMQETAAETRPASGWWVKIDTAALKAATDNVDELATAMNHIAPDWSSKVNLTVTKSSDNPIWTAVVIPRTSGNKVQCGTFHMSICVACNSTSYGAIEVSDPCIEGWQRVQNNISFHTYSGSSSQYIIQSNITVRAESGQKFRFRVCKNGTNTTATNSGMTIRTDSPLLCYFVPDYAAGYVPDVAEE